MLEGAEVTFACLSTFQVWHWSLCKELNITAVCNKEGNWEPISDDTTLCTELTGIIEIIILCTIQLLNCDLIGSSLSQDGIIAIASSISVFIITSILFSVFGYFCGVYRQKQQQDSSSLANKPTPVPTYEDVLPKDFEQKLELQSNIAYAPIHK